jgi:hypothetical protein|nr:MAG TPA: hypothetical protein [Caudoviricetes sp.]
MELHEYPPIRLYRTRRHEKTEIEEKKEEEVNEVNEEAESVDEDFVTNEMHNEMMDLYYNRKREDILSITTDDGWFEMIPDIQAGHLFAFRFRPEDYQELFTPDTFSISGGIGTSDGLGISVLVDRVSNIINKVDDEDVVHSSSASFRFHIRHFRMEKAGKIDIVHYTGMTVPLQYVPRLNGESLYIVLLNTKTGFINIMDVMVWHAFKAALEGYNRTNPVSKLIIPVIKMRLAV